jgi:5,10-methylenetetrahydromethanopterin reductase
LSLLPLITDRHVDALTLAGTVDEVAVHAAALFDAGIDAILARPVAPAQEMIDQTSLSWAPRSYPRLSR